MSDDYVIHVVRDLTQSRPDKSYQRTVSRYQTLFKGQPTGLSGHFVERQGPGDNGPTGVAQHRRIAAGSYPLATHASRSGKYATIGYLENGPANKTPRPCLEVQHTGTRSGILIHPAAGFCMSIGCLNAAGDLPAGTSDMAWPDSRARVVAIIADLRRCLGTSFPTSNDVRIPGAILIVEGEP